MSAQVKLIVLSVQLCSSQPAYDQPKIYRPLRRRAMRFGAIATEVPFGHYSAQNVVCLAHVAFVRRCAQVRHNALARMNPRATYVTQ